MESNRKRLLTSYIFFVSGVDRVVLCCRSWFLGLCFVGIGAVAFVACVAVLLWSSSDMVVALRVCVSWENMMCLF